MDSAAAREWVEQRLSQDPADVEAAFCGLWVYCADNLATLRAGTGPDPYMTVNGYGAVEVFQLLRTLDKQASERDLTARRFSIEGEDWLVVRRTRYASAFAGVTWDGTGKSALSAEAKNLVAVKQKLQGIELRLANLGSIPPDPMRPIALPRATFKEQQLCATLLSPASDFALGVRPIRTWPYVDGAGTADPIVLIDRDGAKTAELRTELAETVEWASANRVHVLVLPELMLSADDAMHFQDLLRANAQKGNRSPAICIVGLGHQPSENAGLSLNEAVVLGPFGGVLWTHRKLDPYNNHSASERLDTGSSLTLVETPIGNMIVGICKDLIGAYQDRYIHSGAEWLLNPSMSESTSAHQVAAQTLVARSLVATVCSNRPFGPTNDTADSWGSFVRLPGRSNVSAGRAKGKVAGFVGHDTAAPGQPGLIVRLDYSSSFK